MIYFIVRNLLCTFLNYLTVRNNRSFEDAITHGTTKG